MAQPPELRLDRLFQFCLARSPTPLERQRLTQYREQLSGESEQEQWTAMGRVLLNLDEMITRE